LLFCHGDDGDGTAGGTTPTKFARGGMCDDAKAYNDYASASVELSDAHVASSSLLSVIRSVRDIDQGKRRRYLYNILLPSSNSTTSRTTPAMMKMMMMTAIPPVELSEAILTRIPSPSGDKLAIFREEVNGAPKRKQVLEVWTNHGQSLLRRILLPEKQHGKVISDAANFGLPSWNMQETALVYVAERMAPETCGFFEKSYDELHAEHSLHHHGSGTTNGNRDVHRGAKNTLGFGKTENWGEKYFKQSALLDIFCVHVETGKVGKVENCPGAESKTTEGGYTLGQALFSPDGSFIIYTAWDAGGGPNMPKRLGLIYCQQRPSCLYASPVTNLMASLSRSEYGKGSEDKDPDGASICLTLSSRLSSSPRFSPVDDNGVSKLVFLSSAEGFDTHSGVFGLSSIDWKNGRPEASSHHVLVDSVWDPKRSSQECGIVAGLRFPGLFMQQLPIKCFLSSDYLLATTQWGSFTRIVRISLRDGTVRLVNTAALNHCSDSLLCVTPESGAVFMSSAPDQLPILWHVNASDLCESPHVGENKRHRLIDMAPIAASKFSSVSLNPNLDFTSDINVLDDLPHVDGVKVHGIPVQTVLLLPNRTNHPNPPLIVIPHGGPHSVSSAVYMPSSAYLCGYGGYAVAFVNYRGSTGFGQGLVASLPTRIGELDVADVVEATKKIQDSGLVDPDRIGICGGSHGGFLTGHCTGRYPDLFRAAVMRNPVVNLPSMVTATDIPDWVFVEALGSYDWHEYRPPTSDELIIMWEKSPIAHVHNVMCPTLIALGLADLRVPPSQGLEWFQTLRSNRVVTKLLLYDDDDHAIAGSQAESDHWVNIKRWFDSHL
jgi:acylaminoacyl-peptidase